MSVFIRKQSSAVHTIGDQLRVGRRMHSLSLKAVSQSLLIPLEQLRHLEMDQFQAIPESMYRELFLKTYATYLGLDWPSLKKQYDSEQALYASRRAPQAVSSLKARQLMNIPQVLKNALLGAAIGGCLVYLVFLGYRAVSPPPLAIWAPVQDEQSGIGQTTVRGKTSRQARLTINGEPVMIRQDGTFEQEVLLSEGLNVIKIGASKKYSKEHSEERRVMYSRGHALRMDASYTSN